MYRTDAKLQQLLWQFVIAPQDRTSICRYHGGEVYSLLSTVDLMSDIAIRVENLGKKYLLNHRQERDRYALRYAIAHGVKQWGKRLLRPRQSVAHSKIEEFWALQGVSCEIQQGDRVGIIGRNGAGKSTLLKILSRITEPTIGRITLKGRVASLLEVGTGFHPELTGRENIYLNGSILGMSRREIERKFDEIVAFAEIERFLDTPVKRYSSGMYVRLAFAVAAHLEPEILVIDEVLAVGDAQFQKKCLGKMEDVAEQEGRTVLFVSHNMAAIQQLTKKAVVLQQGQMLTFSPTGEAVDLYLSSTMNRSVITYDVAHQTRRHQGLSFDIQFISLEFEKYPTKLIPANTDIDVKITVKCQTTIQKFRFSFTLFKIDSTPVGSVFCPYSCGINRGDIKTFRLTLKDLRLAPGLYYFDFAVGKGNDQEGYLDFDIINDVLHFEIMPPDGVDGTQAGWHPSWGAIRFVEPIIQPL